MPRDSWQPAQARCSPGWKLMKLRMRRSSMRFSSSSWKYTAVSAGTRKCALPSASTGTSPRMRIGVQLISVGPFLSVALSAELVVVGPADRLGDAQVPDPLRRRSSQPKLTSLTTQVA